MVSSPIHHKDTLILGVPGCGYETLIAKAQQLKLPIKNVGDFGYRSSSLYPKQWLINLDECYSISTAPWLKPTIWIGYAQNWHALICLPWAKVLRFELPEEKLKERIVGYRKKHDLNSHEPEGTEDSIITGLNTIGLMLASSQLKGIPIPDSPRDLMKYTNVTGKPIVPDEVVLRMRGMDQLAPQGATEFTDFKVISGLIAYVNHPKRMAKGQVQLFQRWLEESPYAVVMGVDGATFKTAALFKSNIMDYVDRGKEYLGIHAATGEYSGHTFVNTDRSNTLVVHDQGWVLMEDSKRVFLDLANQEIARSGNS